MYSCSIMEIMFLFHLIQLFLGLICIESMPKIRSFKAICERLVNYPTKLYIQAITNKMWDWHYQFLMREQLLLSRVTSLKEMIVQVSCP